MRSRVPPDMPADVHSVSHAWATRVAATAERSSEIKGVATSGESIQAPDVNPDRDDDAAERWRGDRGSVVTARLTPLVLSQSL